MFKRLKLAALIATVLVSTAGAAPAADEAAPRRLFVDVHTLGPGSVTAEAVAAAHERDLQVQDRFGTRFLKYWVDEAEGRVVCLSEAPNAASVTETHRAAHGLLPDSVCEVSAGLEAAATGGRDLFLDAHHLGPGEVTAEAVAEAHLLDLETQDRHDVNFLNYWIDEEQGIVWCLAEAPDADALIQTHEEAHGLMPDEVMAVVQGE